MALLKIIRPAGAAALALAAAAAIACGGEQAPGGPSGAIVDTVHVRAVDVPATVHAVGTVEADNQTQVSAEVRGRVSKIIRDEGSRVAAGAAVLQLDPGDYSDTARSAEAELSRASASLAADQKQLERYDKLLAAGAVDQATYDDLAAKVESEKAAVEQARASLASARRDLGKTTVRAPFGGTVGKRHVELGQYVDAQTVLFDLVDAQPVRVRFSVPETYVNEVQVGDPIRFQVRSDTVSSRVASVDYVSPRIDPDTRTFEVTASYANEDLAVRPGSFADVTLTTAVHHGAPVVPEEALYTEDTNNYVYVMHDSTASKRPVRIGSRFDDQVEILSGVKPGEVALTAGQQGLPDGARVRVAENASDETLKRE